MEGGTAGFKWNRGSWVTKLKIWAELSSFYISKATAFPTSQGNFERSTAGVMD